MMLLQPFSGHGRALSLVVSTLLLAGCGGITPVYIGECKELASSKTLYYQQPCEYLLNPASFSDPGPYSLELTLTYYSKIGRTELPLYLNLEDEQHELQEYYFTIPLRKDGRDLGQPAQNEIDLTISHQAISSLDLSPGNHTLRIFYDGERLMENEAKGIIALQVRLYPAEEPAKE